MAYVPTRKQIRAIQPELPPGKRAKALFQTVLNLVQRVVKHKAEAIYKREAKDAEQDHGHTHGHSEEHQRPLTSP